MPLVPYQLSLRHSPAILKRLVGEIPAERYAEPGPDGRFSLLEVVCHLADFERVFLHRIQEAVETDVPEFSSIDISTRAIEKRYAEQDIHAQVEDFAAGRRETVSYLEGLTEDQLARELVQSFGKMTVKEFVSVMSGHDVYHIEQMTEYLGSS